MKIDIIIPLYKPGPEFFTLLDKLEEQSLPIQNIILMNTEEKYFQRLVYGTRFADKYPNVKVYHLSRREFDHGGTRHRGVKASDAEVFVCLTQDAMPVDRLLVERLVGRLTGNVAVSYARQLPDEKSTESEKISRLFNYPAMSQIKQASDLETLGIKTYFCSNVCAAYRRDIYDELGGFIRHTIFNEDMIYAAGAVKAGYAVAYEAEAMVVHSHGYTNLQQLRRNFDLGVSQADHPEIFGEVASESEGKRLVREAWQYLKGKRQRHKFFGFCLQCAFKYTGYFLGRHYDRLPRSWVLKLTNNREYWK